MTQENKEKLKTWRLQKIEECKQFPKYFYYFSFIDNFESIISNGILPKNDIKQKKLITKLRPFQNISTYSLLISLMYQLFF